MASVRNRIDQLREELNRHNYLYHVQAKPTISDQKYDALMRELIDLETAHPEFQSDDSPTQRVGGDVQTTLRSVQHAVPMLSIDNTYDETEVREFDQRVRKGLDGASPRYVLEPKIDGASVSLRYEKGSLVLAATRGRGNTGDDITANARTIQSVPLRLREGGGVPAPPAIVEVRGEVYMDNEDFQRVNTALVEAGEEPYANARNTTAGTLRRLDPKIVAKRKLRFLAHSLGQVDPLPVEDYWDWLELLRGWGLPLPKSVWRVDDIDGAIRCIHEFEKLRPTLPYMTDGMVLKVDSFAQRQMLGANSKAPRWIIAFKYETEQQPTVLRDCRWQVGKGGNLTPVGDLEPVFIGGVTVTHVTLHNIDQIHRLDLHLGDTVIVERAGEVIPYVVEVQKDKRPPHAKPIEAPKKCPVCGTKVERDPLPPAMVAYRCTNPTCKEYFQRHRANKAKIPSSCPKCQHELQVLHVSIEIYCPNPACPAQVKQRLIHFAGRSQMDISGLGDRLIEDLVERGLVKALGDVFRLNVEQLEQLRHEVEIGDKAARKAVEAIERLVNHDPVGKSANVPIATPSGEELKREIARLAKQLKVTGLGEKTIEQLVDSGLVKRFHDLSRLSVEQIARIRRSVRFGKIAAIAVIAAAEAAKNRGLARVLSALGIPHVGTTMAKALAEGGGDIDTLRKANDEELRRFLSRGSKIDESNDHLFAKWLVGALSDDTPSLRHQYESAVDEASLFHFLMNLQRDARAAGALPGRLRPSSARALSLASEFETGGKLVEASEGEVFAALTRRTIAQSFYDYLHSEKGEREIADLESVGVMMREDRKIAPIRSEMTGKTVVITGSFTKFTRVELKELLESRGAKVSDTVSAKTGYLVVGDDAGSKLEKARKLGVKLLSEADVLKMLEAGRNSAQGQLWGQN